MNTILEQSLALNNQLLDDRRHFHQYPETGMDTVDTAAYVSKRLKEMGYDPKPCGQNGVVATVGKGGKTILLRADMDALPMQETTDLPFASSIENRAHTCGHDCHTAMLLSAAQILKNNEESLDGTVKLMFQPGEEIFSGALSMINDGVMENPTVDAAFGMHVFANLDSGYIAYHENQTMASADVFRINITGKGTHGAMPEGGIDPINIAAHIHLALQEIIAREVPPNAPVMLTIGQLHAGSASNIIPATAFMEGTLRTFSDEIRAFAVQRLKEICENTAKTFRGEAEVVLLHEIPTTDNDATLLPELLGYIEALNDDQLKFVEVEASQGSEDFSFVSKRVPSVYLFLGAKDEHADNVPVQHNPSVYFNEDVLAHGVAAYVTCAMNWLTNHKN